jgi:CheY-like chemotaxis protein
MSGYSEGEVATRFAGKGLASVLQKPFHPSELIQTLRRVLEHAGG